MPSAFPRSAFAAFLAVAVAGCHVVTFAPSADDAGIDAGDDAGIDAGVDAGDDAGVVDAGDAGIDAVDDAGVDAGDDAGIDAGDDAGIDAGQCFGESDEELCIANGLQCGAPSTVDHCGVPRILSCGACSFGASCNVFIFRCECDLGFIGDGTTCIALDGGSESDAGPPDAGGCEPASDAELCASMRASCGSVTVVDACGSERLVFCGGCGDNASCEADLLQGSQACQCSQGYSGDGYTCVAQDAGTPDAGSCVPASDFELCTAAARSCGLATLIDNCGEARPVDCGGCGSHATCSEVTGTCACDQGFIPDGELCVAADAGAPDAGVCFPPSDADLCADLVATCGQWLVMDDCGVVRGIDCGSCGANAACDMETRACHCDPGFVGDGLVCEAADAGAPDGGCVGESDADLCTAAAYACGQATLPDRCGTLRSVDCGGCGANASCDVTWQCQCDPGFNGDGQTCTAADAGDVDAGSDAGDVDAGDVDAGDVDAGTDAGADAGDLDAGTDVDAGTPDAGPPPICSSDDWCWVSPWPQGNTLYGVWAAATDDVWAVGDQGTILHWDGADWRPVASPTTALLRYIWGSAANDVWVVADGGIVLHWDGFSWTAQTLARGVPLRGVWGTSANDVWIGGPGYVLHWDGTSWTTTTLAGEIFAIHARAVDDVWAVGNSGSWHWDGAAWTSTWFSGYHVWSIGADDAWVASGGDARHWDGSTWSLRYAINPVDVRGLWGTATDNVWAVGDNTKHWNGTAWDYTPGGSGTSRKLNDIYGLSADDIWAVGEGGAIVHYDGTSWTSSAPKPLTTRYTAVWGASADNVRATGPTGGLFSWDGNAWTKTYLGIGADLYGIWGVSASDIWVVGDHGRVWHYDGMAWSTQTIGTAALYGVWGTSSTNVWAVGYGTSTIRHWDGTAWSSMSNPSQHTLYAVGGATADDVWAVGSAGNMLHWDGTAWTRLPVILNADLRAVWASATDDVWVVGWSKFNLHWNGATWEQIPNGTTTGMNAIWGTAPDNLWSAGLHGALAHWDGNSWTSVDSGTANQLFGIWGSSAQDIWVVGDYATLLHYNP